MSREAMANGPSGTELSPSGACPDETFAQGCYAEKKAKKGNTVYLAVSKGKMAVPESSNGQ